MVRFDNFLTFAVILCQSGCVFGIFPSYFKFYKNGNCFGEDYEYILDTPTNITEIPKDFNSLNWRGPWFVINQVSSGVQYLDSNLLGGGAPNTCYANSSTWMGKIVSITKLLDTDLEISAVALIPDDKNISSVLRFYQQSEYQLPKSQKFKHISLTGVNDYTFYEGTNFNGSAFCLKADRWSDEKTLFGSTRAHSGSLYGRFDSIGSFKMGDCKEYDPWIPTDGPELDANKFIRKINCTVNGGGGKVTCEY